MTVSLTGFSVTPVINLSATTHTITFTISGTGGVKVAHVLYSPHLGGSDDGDSSLLGTNGDSWADGTSHVTETVSTGAPAQTYTITAITLSDQVNPIQTFNTAYLAGHGFQTTFKVINSDTTPPDLVSLTFPSAIDVTAGPQPITFNAHATDDASGIKQVIVHFDKSFESGTGTTGPGLVVMTGGNGDSWADDFSHVTDTVAETVNGVFTITSVDVTDGANLTHTYTGDQLLAAHIISHKEVTITGGHIVDKTPPVLDSITLPAKVTIGDGKVHAFPIDVHAHDPSGGTGIKNVIIYIDRGIQVSTGGAGGFILDGSNDCFCDGESKATWYIASNNTPGPVTITHIDVTDNRGNKHVYSNTDLAKLHLPTSFVMLDNSYASIPSSHCFSGSEASNKVTGTHGNDVFFTLGGNDVIHCNGGHDSCWGGKGNDSYYVDNAADRIFESSGQGTDRVYADVSFTLKVHVSVEIISTWSTSSKQKINLTGNELANTIMGNSAANVLSGGGGSDTCRGYSGNDTLKGGTGNDKLIGGNGCDHLWGNAGADKFIYDTLAASVVGSKRDQILDFSHTQHDRIDLHLIDADKHHSGNQAFHFINSAHFHSTSTSHVYGELRYSGHVLQGDINGDGHADFEIHVNASSLVKGDFVL